VYHLKAFKHKLLDLSVDSQPVHFFVKDTSLLCTTVSIEEEKKFNNSDTFRVRESVFIGILRELHHCFYQYIGVLTFCNEDRRAIVRDGNLNNRVRVSLIWNQCYKTFYVCTYKCYIKA